jgi:hypothetical protein
VANLQIKNFPDELYERASGRAEEEDRSVSNYLTREFADSLERPTLDEWFAERDQALSASRRPPVSHADVLAALDAARQEYDPDERFLPR